MACIRPRTTIVAAQKISVSMQITCLRCYCTDAVSCCTKIILTHKGDKDAVSITRALAEPVFAALMAADAAQPLRCKP